jgi:hypothetical protein
LPSGTDVAGHRGHAGTTTGREDDATSASPATAARGSPYAAASAATGAALGGKPGSTTGANSAATDRATTGYDVGRSAGGLGATLFGRLAVALVGKAATGLGATLLGQPAAGLGRQDSNGAATGIVAGSSVRIPPSGTGAGLPCTGTPSGGVRTAMTADCSGGIVTVRSDDVTSVPCGVGRAGFCPPETRAMSSLTAVFSSFAIESPYAYVCDVHAGSRTHVDFAREIPQS